MKKATIKNVAVIVAGIDEEYQNNIINGINAFARKNNVNIAYFAAFGGVLANNRYDIGEYNIYNLVNYSKFDGVILMTNTICAPSVKEKIYSNVKNAGIPAVVFDCDDYPEFFNISIDNSKAMKDIVRHVVECHNAKIINFISGPLSNPEAEDRYNSFVEVMNEKSLDIEKNRIFFGEFRGIDGKKAVDTFIASGQKLPDAIICANDAMALTAINALEKHGLKVPKDIIVTGFDNTYNARHFCPALTTVSRPLFDAGFKACEVLTYLIDGKKYDKDTRLEAFAEFSESCGCVTCSDYDFTNFKKGTYKLIENCRCDISLLNRMTSALAETESADESFSVISNFLEEIECEKFSICLCSEWQGALAVQASTAPSRDCLAEGYSTAMSAPLIWDKGEKRTVAGFNSSDMFPEALESGGNINYFLPLHFRERCIGYYIISNSEFPIHSMLCHSIMMNISNSIENIRKLLHLNNAISELDKLYAVDPLCNIFNRNGFIRISDRIYKDCAADNKKVMIAFLDMDGLKMINDNYGHNEGDFALQKLADIIRECCTSKLICARFGGDEFIIFGADVNEEEVQLFEHKLTAKLDEINRILNKPYPISASMGTYLTSVTPDMPLFQIITKADEKMYEQKKRKSTSRYLRRT